MSKPDKKLYVREFYLDNHLEKDQAFNWSTRPLPGYVPVTIIRGHDPHRLLEDVPPPIPSELITSTHKESLPIKCRWIIKHKTSGHKLTTKEEYISFDETIVESWPGQLPFRYTNYEAIGPYVEKN